MKCGRLLWVVILAGYGLFAAVEVLRTPDNIGFRTVPDRVVMSAPVQLILAGGDRFLAANLESTRAVATSSDSPGAIETNAQFGIRARRVVAQLNPCHEDNYYYGNALLTWGGSVAEGNDLLRRATECRTWDELPPFFYGFNQFFFLHDVSAAREAIEAAASRATENAAVFRKFAIMIAAGEFRDDEAALEYLTRERDQAADPKLRQMLDRRVGRLAGLLQLRAAQQAYEIQFGKPLTDPLALLEHGLLKAYPDDPMRIGYEFADGRFRLKEIQIAGLERHK